MTISQACFVAGANQFDPRSSDPARRVIVGAQPLEFGWRQDFFACDASRSRTHVITS